MTSVEAPGQSSPESVMDFGPLARLRATPRGAIRDGGSDVSVVDLLRHVERFSAGLSALGVAAGARVLLFAGPGLDFVVAALSIERVGATAVLVDPETRSESLLRICVQTGPRAAIVDGPYRLAVLLSVRHRAPALSPIVVLDGAAEQSALSMLGDPGVDGAIAQGALERVGDELLARLPLGDSLDGEHGAILASDGVENDPRPLFWSNAAFLAQVDALGRLALRTTDVVHVSLSPAAPDVRAIVYRALIDGATVSFGPVTAERLMVVAPTLLVACPSDLERMYTEFVIEATRAGGLPLRLFRWARAVGSEVSYIREGRRETDLGLRTLHRAATYTVGRRLRARLGGRVSRALCLRGPLASRICRFFHGLDVDVQHVYGCVDAAPVSHVGVFGTVRFNVIGPPLPGVEARLTDGRLELRAPGLAPVALATVALATVALATSTAGASGDTRSDVWCDTRDAAEIDGEGILKRAERVTGVLDVTESVGQTSFPGTLRPGRRLVLASTLESDLCSSPYIARAVVLGSGRPFLVALIALDVDAVMAFVRERGMATIPPATLPSRPEVFALINSVVEGVNAERPSFEAIRKFAVLEHGFAVETGELSASGRIRRRAIEARHAALIDSFYKEQY